MQTKYKNNEKTFKAKDKTNTYGDRHTMHSICYIAVYLSVTKKVFLIIKTFLLIYTKLGSTFFHEHMDVQYFK